MQTAQEQLPSKSRSKRPLISNFSPDDYAVRLTEAAARLAMSVDNLRLLAKDGKITILKLSPRRHAILDSEIKRFLKEAEPVKKKAAA